MGPKGDCKGKRPNSHLAERAHRVDRQLTKERGPLSPVMSSQVRLTAAKDPRHCLPGTAWVMKEVREFVADCASLDGWDR